MVIEKIVMFATAAVLVMPASLFISNDLGTEMGCFEIETFETRIPTDGGDISGSLAIKVHQPVEEGRYPSFVMCPGSWEPSAAWNVYFKPFTPEFIASRGYVVISWDPRGSFMLYAGANEITDYLDPARYGIGDSSPFPPAILMESTFFVEDLYNVITFANDLPKVREDEIGIIGFSHGASYPIIEKVMLNDDRVKLIVSIEPIGDEASLVAMLTSGIPVIEEVMQSLIRALPEKIFDLIWGLLRVLKTVGLPSHYIEDLDCDLIVIQSTKYHASLGLSTCVEPGLTVYNGAVNSPYRRLNRNPPNIEIDQEHLEDYDWFPAPIWGDGDLFCQYFIDCVKPLF